MDLKVYNEFIDYLLRHNYSSELTSQQKQKLARQDREKILYNLHSSPLTKYFGLKKTIENTTRKYYWSGIRADIKTYIESCNKAKVIKEATAKETAKSLAKSLQTSEFNWDKLISSILFTYRTLKQEFTKYTPFYLVYGREVQLPIDIEFQDQEQNLNPIENFEEFLNKRIIVSETKTKRKPMSKYIKDTYNAEYKLDQTVNNEENFDTLLRFTIDPSKSNGQKIQAYFKVWN
ncbi:2722_t:CDS:2 [Diversispora eburnea]|uniref:2722_t:CDS:1 n=1 Tax=Diversispora eburnea TaxID=1213867 RepID=A0A9N9BMY1_9GLOM|nr:2722_t:CDS:2 [Diversispora eburnea]